MKRSRGVDALLSPQDLASFLQIPLSTIYYWRYTGEGPPALRVGRMLRYDMADVRAWLKTRAG